MSRQHPTPHEQELRHRFVLMLKAGRDIGLTVDDCIRAVRSDRRLEQGYYDESLYDETMRMEDAFAQRAYYYAVKQGRPVRHRRRDEE